jgi:hypothetical protein
VGEADAQRSGGVGAQTAHGSRCQRALGIAAAAHIAAAARLVRAQVRSSSDELPDPPAVAVKEDRRRVGPKPDAPPNQVSLLFLIFNAKSKETSEDDENIDNFVVFKLTNTKSRYTFENYSFLLQNRLN